MTTRRHLMRLVPGLAVAMASSSAARAQAWPQRSLRIIVPYVPGGATDIVARVVGAAIGAEFGQPVVVDNRSGGSGNIAMEQATQAASDGYTYVVTTVAQAVNMTLFRKIGYDLERFAPVAFLSYYSFILVVNPDLPVKSFQELVGLTRRRPLNYASSGNGSAPHIGMSLLCNMANIEMTHVPYRGSGPAVADLISGSCQLMFDSPPSVLPQIRAGKLRAIAVTGLERSPELPDVPTVAESGLPGFEVLGWNGLLAPAGTPTAILAKMYEATARALADPQVKERFEQAGARTRPMSRDAFGAFLHNEVAKWADAVRKSGAQVD
jgi:tripartite-type tricarboxylate transporter receptor subunit TctC